MDADDGADAAAGAVADAAADVDAKAAPGAGAGDDVVGTGGSGAAAMVGDVGAEPWPGAPPPLAVVIIGVPGPVPSPLPPSRFAAE